MKGLSRWIGLLKILAISFGVTLAVFVYPLLLDLWVENESGESQLYGLLKGFFEKKWSPIYFFMLLGITGFIIVFNYRELQMVKDKAEQSEKDKARTLLGLYDDLQQFDLQKNVKNLMEVFTKKHDAIFSVQLYRFEELPQKHTVVSKVNYVDGYVKDRTELNGIIQQFYYVSKDLYRDYKRAINAFKKDTEKVGPLLNFILTNVDYLNKKHIRSLDEQDMYRFAFIMDAYTLLERSYGEITDVIIDNRIMSKLDYKIKEKKRIGIFRGFLVNHFYTFYYLGTGSKEGRQYITTPVELRNVKHVILIALDPFLLEDDSETHMAQFAEEFHNMLHEFFEKGYNKLR